MNESQPITIWKVLATLAHLALALGCIWWLDRRQGKPSLKWFSIFRATLLVTPLAIPFLAAYWFISTPDPEWRQLLLVLPVFGPIFLLMLWGMWKFKMFARRPSQDMHLTTLLALFALLLCSCRSCPEVRSSSPALAATAQPAMPAPRPILYRVSAGGPHLIVGLDTRPESNHVAIAFHRQGEASGIFRLTNREPVSVLIWNVRVQVPSKGPGTDGFSWDTVHDDYPTGLKLYNIPPGGFDEIEAPMYGAGPWRVCVLYSKERKVEAAKGRQFFGNYEVISLKVDEDQLRGPIN